MSGPRRCADCGRTVPTPLPNYWTREERRAGVTGRGWRKGAVTTWYCPDHMPAGMRTVLHVQAHPHG